MIYNEWEKPTIRRYYIEDSYNQYCKEVLNNMATLKETAQDYEPPQIKNIAELDKVSIDFELFDAEGTNKEGIIFKYKFIEVNGEKYRIPGSVIGDIKVILEQKPKTKIVKITKKGEGINTKYTTIPMD